ncbi:TadE/TadG family type IV pilus assembly protein [Streptomyces sp. RPT161]|uniref:TadE/TadG family type IV pilus assembly protein n=1 Tax=Streptomyces sp. RPT161 TaxID=3015993 RepID=UPI0022B85FB4|nr:TadE/TadG family type IV pilus assembly protein [Streptomyces sp. RPT161]
MLPDHEQEDNRRAKQARSLAPAGREDRGAVAAETVIATPLLLLLLLLIVQFALAWHAQHIAQTAASRALAITRAQGSSAAAGRAQAAATLHALGHSVLRDPHITIARTNRTATIDVRGWAEPVVPGIHVPISAHDAGAIDRWSTPVEKG